MTTSVIVGRVEALNRRAEALGRRIRTLARLRHAIALDGVETERRLVMTWNAHWDESVNKDRASRVTYEHSAAGSATKLRLVHDGFEGENATYAGSIEGWPLMLSSLKSILETGKALPVR
jgi:hypothetical protein